MENVEEEENELLPDSDDESVSETEDQGLPEDKTGENSRHNLIPIDHSITEFVFIKILLILLTLSVLILLPLYMETINVSGDVYSLILTNTFLSALVLVQIMLATKVFWAKYKLLKVLNLPIKLPKLCELSFIYFLCGIVILYALDRKRVVCHLQDPLKALILVWSFLYYFFFCQRFMCLQRILSITIIIVGLFVAVDYSLCNEFKCRGYERQHISDDRGNWTMQSHIAWTFVYVGGLALCAAFYTRLEHALSSVTKMPSQDTHAPLLSTVSNTVSTNSACSSTQNLVEDANSHKKVNALHLAMWLHIFGVLITVALYWSDFITLIGKGTSGATTWNYTLHGIRCHFSNESGCNNVAAFSWLFMFAYVAFFVTSVHFLELTQSSVYTVATMTTAVPLAGIWWSLFQMVPLEKGLFIWNPSFTGEIISSFLGLPIIMVGLYFLYKSHFKDYQWSTIMITSRSLPASHR